MDASAIYSGSGNIFVLVDARRDGDISSSEVVSLCRQYRSDGLVVLRKSREADFKMEFFNPDASCGMMCGNGGRCIAAFAYSLGIKPSERDGYYVFEAPDALHQAKVFEEGSQVRLSMRNVQGFEKLPDGGFFIDSGALHRIVFVADVESVDVLKEGRKYRNSISKAPLGTNVDFVQICGQNFLKVRTFEKGVEAETAACGTGITASALAFWASKGCPCGRATVRVQALRDTLTVEFTCKDSGFSEIFLSGRVEKINY